MWRLICRIRSHKHVEVVEPGGVARRDGKTQLSRPLCAGAPSMVRATSTYVIRAASAAVVYSSARRHKQAATIVAALVAANVAVFLFWQHKHAQRDDQFMVRHFTVTPEEIRRGKRRYTLLTSVFSHQDPRHLLTNLANLARGGGGGYVGALLLGPTRFMVLYVVGGVVSSCCVTAWPYLARHFNMPARRSPSPDSHTLGTSGALCAICMYTMLRLPADAYISVCYGFVPLTASTAAIAYFVADGVGLVAGKSVSLFDPLGDLLPGSYPVSYAAHVGGYLTGAAWYALLG